MSTSGMVHNNFFLKIFKDRENAADFIKGALPPDIVRIFDMKS